MEENQHMDIWDALAKPPPNMLKKITGGRLNGMTDIKPQWRTQAMTEQFGPCSTGWGYNIVDIKNENIGDETVVTIIIDLWYNHGGNAEDAHIPGLGSSKILEQESKGPHVNDEAYKMALTDALSVAMKALGVAAAIYLGQWDGGKYNTPTAPKPQPPKDVTPPEKGDMRTHVRCYLDDAKIDGRLTAKQHNDALVFIDGLKDTALSEAVAAYAEKLGDDGPLTVRGDDSTTGPTDNDEIADKAFTDNPQSIDGQGEIF